ncbi:MAG: RDD family protein [Planctomycetes bacterium]|nr:RDD family protein [Planctomycetota bacterium]
MASVEVANIDPCLQNPAMQAENEGEIDEPAHDIKSLPKQAFAGPFRRLIAFVLDCLIVVPTALLIAWPLGTLPFLFDRAAESVGLFGLSPTVAKFITNGCVIMLYDIYFTGTLRASGYTLGMHILDVAVVDGQGHRPSKSTARRRYFCTVLSVIPFGLGLLAMFWHPQKRTWHDRMVGTWALRLQVLKHVEENAGIERKHQAPITTGVLLFLPGMALAAGVILLVVPPLGLLLRFARRRAR